MGAFGSASASRKGVLVSLGLVVVIVVIALSGMKATYRLSSRSVFRVLPANMYLDTSRPKVSSTFWES